MKKLIITLLVVLALVFIGSKVLNKKETKESETTIGNLTELFPSKKQEMNYKIGDKTVKGTTSVVTEEKKTTVTLSYTDKEKNTINRIYEMFDDKLVESSKTYKGKELINEAIATEVITSMPYVGLTYTSVDGLITYKVTEMKNNKIRIESTQKVMSYEKDKAVEKESKIIRVFEKSKGLVLYETELDGKKNTILKLK